VSHRLVGRVRAERPEEGATRVVERGAQRYELDTVAINAARRKATPPVAVMPESTQRVAQRALDELLARLSPAWRARPCEDIRWLSVRAPALWAEIHARAARVRFCARELAGGDRFSEADLRTEFAGYEAAWRRATELLAWRRRTGW
jgi:hypothetical protein